MSVAAAPSVDVSLETLTSIEERVRWLAVRIVDHANRERPAEDALKVGGHQASSASMVTLMTALWLVDLQAADRVSVKPHASPVLHALEYLLGRLDQEYLTQLRAFRGLQSYPSRTKDPFPVDFSTGSVGLGSAAPLFAALADRYVESHFQRSTGGRFISLLGDAELDEGSIWEALAEPLTRGLGNVLWIVDLNRQSLDRVIPGIRAAELEAHFRVNGWDVIELKYGRKLRDAFARPGGDALRRRIDDMSNEEYQSLFGAQLEAVADIVLEPFDPRERDFVRRLLGDTPTELLYDLGGHDLVDVSDGLARARRTPDRPTVIFAYTIKGHGLEIAGRPHNHAVLLTAEQIDRLRDEIGLTVDDEWGRFDPESAEGRLLAAARIRLDRGARPPARPIKVPERASAGDPPAVTSTQAAFGRLLVDLSRSEELGPRVVTVSPDVAVSTNLGGFVNRAGVWSPQPEPAYEAIDDSPLRWRVDASGKHIEVGIAEMNLVLLLGQLGLTWDFQGERLFPIGTLYDPFVMRALEGIVFSVYSGAQFVIAGTPSGISLSREGGAHQSLNTPGIGIETPALTYAEPCYARELEWLLLDGLKRMQAPDGEALYLRLSTKPVEQAPFAEWLERVGPERARRAVISGAYRLREAGPSSDHVAIATCGAMVPEALAAAEVLEADEGVAASIVVLSSPDRAYRDWRAAVTQPLADGTAPGRAHVAQLLTRDGQMSPIVTVIDGASHALAWLGSAAGTRCVPLGVDSFGQTGSLADLYREYRISSEAIITAALVALEPTP